MPWDGRDGYVSTLETLARLLEPRKALGVAAWAHRYRVLVAKTSAERGKWRNERIPYLVAIMNSLDPLDPSPVVIFVKSSQVGGSELALNWILRTIHQQPGSFLCLFPSEKDARKWVRTRLEEAIAVLPELRALVPLGRVANNSSTLTEKHYRDGVLFTGSANVPSDVASISVPYFLGDEIDRMPPTIEGEGDPIELALRRSANFPLSKALLISTPTTFEGSRIWKRWGDSTKDRYFVPCHHCDHMQHLRWDHLTWIAGKPDSAVYACESCGATIEEHRKEDFLAAGEWRSEQPEMVTRARGFHINGLYTPIGLGDSWAKHVEAWERSQGSEAAIQVFQNTRMGEVHKGNKTSLEWQTLHGRREPYPLGTVPAEALLLTSDTDVQKDRVETQVIGWGVNESAWVVDYIVHYGDPTREEVWKALDVYLQREFPRADGGRAMRLSCSLVDARYLTNEVLQFTYPRRARGIYAAQGSPVASKYAIGKPTPVDVRWGGEIKKRGAERYEIGVSQIKHWLFERLRADEGTADEPVLPADRHVHFSDELPEEYFRQLCAEVFDPETNKWVQTKHYHNEALDTFVLARAAAMHHKVALHRLRASDWELLRQRVTAPAKETQVATVKDAGTKPVPLGVSGFFPTSAKVRQTPDE